MDAAAPFRTDETRSPALLLQTVAAGPDESRRPAQSRLEDLIGAELARRLVSALASRLR